LTQEITETSTSAAERDLRDRDQPKKDEQRKEATRIGLFSWKRLSTLRNIQFLRISYAVLVLVPLVASLTATPLGTLFHDVPLSMRLGYLAALFLSLAHMILQGLCPQRIRRFDSPNDLYRDMLEIKALQQQYLPSDPGFEFDIAHCRDGFDRANFENWVARLVCGVLYVAGVILVLWVVMERSLAVFGYER